MEEIAKFKSELTRLVNMHGYDTVLDMPDYIIANLIYSSLDSIVKAHEANKEWHNSHILSDPEEHIQQIVNSGPSFMEKYTLKNRPKITLRTKIIIAKCIAFPVYFITMPITFIVGGARGLIETWKMFIETDRDEVKNA
jgi:hypothetical protein